MALAEEIRGVLERHEMTHRALADHLGVARPTVTNWTRGRSLVVRSPVVRERLRALGATIPMHSGPAWARKLRMARIRKGWHVSRVADLLGVSARTVWDYESGASRPDKPAAEILRQCLGVDVPHHAPLMKPARRAQYRAFLKRRLAQLQAIESATWGQRLQILRHRAGLNLAEAAVVMGYADKGSVKALERRTREPALRSVRERVRKMEARLGVDLLKRWRKMSEGERLREVRHRQGMSHHEIADRAGIAASVVARLERGDTLLENSEVGHWLLAALAITHADLQSSTPPWHREEDERAAA